MLILKCISCGQRHKPETVKTWGRTRESSGYGSVPRCTALVDGDGPKAPDGSTPQQFCGGMLGVVDEPIDPLREEDADGRILEAVAMENGRPLYVNWLGERFTFMPLTPIL